jgi:hypothetical protein
MLSKAKPKEPADDVDGMLTARDTTTVAMTTVRTSSMRLNHL